MRRSILFTVLFVLLLTNMQVMAASQKALNNKAIKAYQKVLNKGSFTYTSYGYTHEYEIGEFTVLDVNRDGIKEMITQSDKWGTKFLWVLKGSKAKPVITFDSYQGCSILYSKKNKAVKYPTSMTAGMAFDGFLRMKSRTKVSRFEWGTRYLYNDKDAKSQHL